MSDKTLSSKPHTQCDAFNSYTSIGVGILLLVVLTATILLLFTPAPDIAVGSTISIWPIQYVLAPSVIILCGLAACTLVVKRYLTRYVIVFIILLTFLIALIVGYSLSHHSGPHLNCHYDPNITISTDFDSHQVCVGVSADPSTYEFISNPFIVNTTTIGTLIGVASLVRYLMISRNIQTQ